MSSEPDARSTSEEILDDNGINKHNDYTGAGYGGTEQAFEAIERVVNEYVDDQRVISSQSLANAVDHDTRV